MPKNLNLRAGVSTWSGGASQDHLHAGAKQCLASCVWWQGARSLCQHGGLVFPQISWLLQVSMGTTPTETLSVAGNIFVGQVRSWAADPDPQCLQLSLPWRKGPLPPCESCGALYGPIPRTAGFSLPQTEAPLLIRPYLADMTLSEIHAVMTGGFSTIAGSVMGAYISFGVSAQAVGATRSLLQGTDMQELPWT